jgi:hypothetical protein
MSDGQGMIPIHQREYQAIQQEDIIQLDQLSHPSSKNWLLQLFKSSKHIETPPRCLALANPGRLIFESRTVPGNIRHKGPPSFTDTELWIEAARLVVPPS